MVDSCPVPVCANIRIRRCQLYQDAAYRGYCASKKRYFQINLRFVKCIHAVTPRGFELKVFLSVLAFAISG